MRNTESSGKTSLTIALSSLAVFRSWPNGFSITTRRQPVCTSAPASPARLSCLSTTGKALGGMDR